MKYIVLEVQHPDRGRIEVPVVFPEVLIHKQVAMALRHCDDMRSAKPVAAGFLSSFGMADVACYGRSESLDLNSRGAVDSKLMETLDATGGMK